MHYKLNFGPQHPSAHGVLRLILNLLGEQVQSAIPHIGLLHRGTEKLMENKTLLQGLPYMDRLDYVSMLVNEHVCTLAGEKILFLDIPLRAQYLRTLFDEITRLLNHLMAITTHAMDVGALTPFLWGFEEREKMMEFYERASGARLHAAYYRVGGLHNDVPKYLLKDINLFFTQFGSRIDEIEELLTKNRVWQNRLKNIGVLSASLAQEYGITGVLLRSASVAADLRTTNRYEIYSKIDFCTVLGQTGDSYDRFLLRIEELKKSLILSKQVLDLIPSGCVISANTKGTTSARSTSKFSMEKLIHHFLEYAKGTLLKFASFFLALEAPKGQLGVFMETNNTQKPYRSKIRAPGFFHLQATDLMTQNLSLADVVTIIGTQDIVFGEVDR